MNKLIWMSAGALMAIANPALAQNFEMGRVQALYADPGNNPDFVIELDRRGRCGSSFYHLNRSFPNFQQSVDLAKLALAHDKKMLVWIIGCRGDRQLLSHAGAAR
ncbi:hypothetical protein IZ6_05160 [Terrihabitans soli]|uniref:Uncharacterized protein n=1 Tax=Terrihabitans soli TaxID=708113 RepID=A0A6S6QRX2_9HYPH|nr:hypothetical protein [Terrihabitans soli]BCJ89781.1 hypothetical protein IZ6_05160 [Terrihabitans soli]